ncbi:GUANYLATE BINDING PROTEIN [Salix purpurea]|uniref:GUANYLATE BINDING PROTEIN n=1 Tax=Salix purpurea TaxID=77065 RepID=A0A9Q0URM7_SALPP|nr:GUANYLATE BINDING PROTEIN [Salix purpurea]
MKPPAEQFHVSQLMYGVVVIQFAGWKQVRNSKQNIKSLYEDTINDLNKVSECYKSCITELAKKCSSLDERYSRSHEMLDSAKQESSEWRRKYERTWNNPWNGGDNMTRHGIRRRQLKTRLRWKLCRGLMKKKQDLPMLMDKLSEHGKKANEWKEKCDIAVNELKANIEKENIVLEYPIEDVNCREEALRAKSCSSLTEKMMPSLSPLTNIYKFFN